LWLQRKVDAHDNAGDNTNLDTKHRTLLCPIDDRVVGARLRLARGCAGILTITTDGTKVVRLPFFSGVFLLLTITTDGTKAPRVRKRPSRLRLRDFFASLLERRSQ
jgi:hypothetical protein